MKLPVEISLIQISKAQSSANLFIFILGHPLPSILWILRGILLSFYIVLYHIDSYIYRCICLLYAKKSVDKYKNIRMFLVKQYVQILILSDNFRN